MWLEPKGGVLYKTGLVVRWCGGGWQGLDLRGSIAK